MLSLEHPTHILMVGYNHILLMKGQLLSPEEVRIFLDVLGCLPLEFVGTAMMIKTITCSISLHLHKVSKERSILLGAGCENKMHDRFILPPQ